MKPFYPVGRVWNPNAIDYSKGVDITDYLTGIVYIEEEAYKQPPEIRARLTNKGRVIGCWLVREWLCTENYKI